MDTPGALAWRGGAVAAGMVNRNPNRGGRLARRNSGNQASGGRGGRTLERCRTAAVHFRQSNEGGFNVFQGLLYPCEGGHVLGALSRVTR